MSEHLNSILKDVLQQAEELDFSVLGNADVQSEAEKEEAWLMERLGRFTSSEFHRLMGNEDKLEFPKGAITYSNEKALEVLTEFGGAKKYKGEAMQWGSDTEKEACIEFMRKYDIEVSRFAEEQEFFKKGEHIGGTPDGIITVNGKIEGGIETKCPESKTHLYYLMNVNLSNFKKLLTDYYWQCQGNMYVTGAKYWYFISYDPRFKDVNHRLFVLKIMRNESDLLKLRRRLSGAIKMKTEILTKMKS